MSRASNEELILKGRACKEECDGDCFENGESFVAIIIIGQRREASRDKMLTGKNVPEPGHRITLLPTLHYNTSHSHQQYFVCPATEGCDID